MIGNPKAPRQEEWNVLCFGLSPYKVVESHRNCSIPQICCYVYTPSNTTVNTGEIYLQIITLP